MFDIIITVIGQTAWGFFWFLRGHRKPSTLADQVNTFVRTQKIHPTAFQQAYQEICELLINEKHRIKQTLSTPEMTDEEREDIEIHLEYIKDNQFQWILSNKKIKFKLERNAMGQYVVQL